MTTPSAPIPVRPPVPTQPWNQNRGEAGNPLTNAQAAASWRAGVAAAVGVVSVK